MKKIVCLGGGIGTVNLLKGLKKKTDFLTAVVSMADEGGSSGRLRRLYNTLPPGDLVSCMAALSDESDSDIAKLLTYRFPGNRYGADTDLGGHKLGNLLLIAASDVTNSFESAIQLIKRLFKIKGDIYPATTELVHLTAITVEGKEIHGEEKIDLGQYDGRRVLDRVLLSPRNPKIAREILTALEGADLIIAGPGDLYTTILPVLIIPEIKEFLMRTKTSKFFITNVANKPFETKGYAVSNYINAVFRNLGIFPFHKVIANSNFKTPIPREYQYTYVQIDAVPKGASCQIVASDLVDETFPLYHDPDKLAKAIYEEI